MKEAVDEVVFVQDAAGNYLSLSCQCANLSNIASEQILGSKIDGVFGPVDVASYIERIERVLNCLAPERFRCGFHYGDISLVLDLVMVSSSAARPTAKGCYCGWSDR